jgi:hypothetical protein
MSDELSLPGQIAVLNEERRLMEKLIESDGWKRLVSMVKESISVLQQRGDTRFLQTTFGEDKLDGIQSLVFEGYSKGIRAGMSQILEVPMNLVTHNSDMVKLLEGKIAMSEGKEQSNGSSTNDGTDDSFADPDGDSIASHDAP